MRDKIHMEQVERWAKFVKTSSRREWKKAVNLLVDEQYKKATKFYNMLNESEKGRKILEKLRKVRVGLKR